MKPLPTFRLFAGACIASMALASAPSLAQRVYPSAEAAAQALHDAVSRKDAKALQTVLGESWQRFVPFRDIAQGDLDAFMSAWDKQHKIVRDESGRRLVSVGESGWTLPIPIVGKSGGWRFDPRAGEDAMRTRLIGRNELGAMQAVLAYYDAQREYALHDHDGNGVLEYAQKIISTPGKHDGLYWTDATPQAPSPLGPLFEGRTQGEGYYGYRFKILAGQGKDASGGAYSYVIGGRMRSGFALIAWPVRYGQTGVASFMVNHEGVLYEKDLGAQTESAAGAVDLFNPDASWTKVNMP